MKILLKLFAIILSAWIFCLFPDNGRGSEPVKIVFLTWKPNQPKIWELLINDFHRKNPDILIQLQIGPHSSTEYHAIVTQRLKNRDKNVDVFFMDVIWPAEFANAGWALDLSPKFSVNDRIKFLQGPIAANTYKGKIYGVPCYLAAGLFYYRDDLLQKYGFEPPSTWTEMINQGKLILSGENDPGTYVYSAQFKQYEGLVCNMLEFVWSYGGDVLEVETGISLLSKPGVLIPTRFVRDNVIGEAAPQGVVNYEEPESLDLFIQGKAVFHRNWPYAWAIANDPKKSRIAGKVSVGTLPVFGKNVPSSALGGWQFGINKFSKNPDEAWKFIKYMTSHESQRALALDASLAPARKSVYQLPEVIGKMPHLIAFLPTFEKARPRPVSPVYPMISQELQRFFSGAISTKTSNLEEMARGAAERINRVARLNDSAR